ncbi:MAG: serine/threonine protein kinase [Neobacillus sp.]
MQKDKYTHLIGKELLPNIQLSSVGPFDPIIVRNHSKSWKIIGIGNYAGVFTHESNPQWVVKVYGRKPEELIKEVEVYRKLGEHKTFSTLIDYGENFLILKRIEGITIFDAVLEGIPIPESVITDVDKGIAYARSVGLNPFDVHGKNVVMSNGRGYIVDVSDFYKIGVCRKWIDLKRAYYKIYKPFLYKYHPSVPFFILDSVRKGYRFYRKLKALD